MLKWARGQQSPWDDEDTCTKAGFPHSSLHCEELLIQHPKTAATLKLCPNFLRYSGIQHYKLWSINHVFIVRAKKADLNNNWWALRNVRLILTSQPNWSQVLFIFLLFLIFIWFWRRTRISLFFFAWYNNEMVGSPNNMWLQDGSHRWQRQQQRHK